ncbi:hypothetical protein JVX88_35645 [Leptolyngbya sp. 7M]|nr:hypothetical protein JVX88_35645 [Leptolyngbya sp. 7M]
MIALSAWLQLHGLALVGNCSLVLLLPTQGLSNVNVGIGAGWILLHRPLVAGQSRFNVILLPKQLPEPTQLHRSCQGRLQRERLERVAGGSASSSIQIILPDGWQVRSSAERRGRSEFLVTDVSRAVFVVAKDLRSTQVKVGDFEVEIALNSSWHFSDTEASRMVEEILVAYKGIFGTMPSRSAQLAILRPPVERAPDFWEAETRGNTIIIISSDTAFSDRSQQRLHEQLRHELFHLWLPNGVRLTGEYAWFYEGFALYSSLKLAVKVRRIRFQDLLETLSRAYAIDSRQNPRTPLIGLSQQIAGPPNTQTYARGLLIAFLVDLELMRSSSGSSDSASLMRSIFREFKDRDKPVDANEALMSIHILRNAAQRFVFGSEAIDLVKELNGTGVEAVQGSGHTKLSVKSKLNGREQKILDGLGYNSWRGSPRVQKR